jgi:hypothetical protein
MYDIVAELLALADASVASEDKEIPPKDPQRDSL